jgi:hypothetical protein
MFNWKDKELLEEAAAKVLGRILWEFGSLEAGLGVVLAWSRGAAELDAMSGRVDGMGFHERLRLLAAVVDERSHQAKTAYESWITDAHRLRMTRNDFVHGRWAVTADGQIANVVGVMTKADQTETRYSLAELELILEELLQLHQRLRTLHTRSALGY